MKVFDSLFEGLADQHGVTVMPVLLKPKSRGTVRLRSSDPLDPPKIDPKYLSNSQDIKHLIEGMFLLQQ